MRPHPYQTASLPTRILTYFLPTRFLLTVFLPTRILSNTLMVITAITRKAYANLSFNRHHIGVNNWEFNLRGIRIWDGHLFVSFYLQSHVWRKPYRLTFQNFLYFLLVLHTNLPCRDPLLSSGQIEPTFRSSWPMFWLHTVRYRQQGEILLFAAD